eukprot:TRINITY_DN5686_c0_g1_i1.p1 TRINITY_DN5686_c0_g1~~TRINITY_DN5686_c0_g1_i1.p1  ORF type:complete len:481 (-),score=64.51 TRINITY_DN5686_c0_g1_i1:162-1604(-)
MIRGIGFEWDVRQPYLGKGSFATVICISDRKTRKGYAVKVMDRRFFQNHGIGHLVDLEIEALRRCVKLDSCRHVVRLMETIEEGDRVFLRLELCHGTLLQLAQGQPGGRLSDSDGARYSRQLLLGLHDIHATGILHRDVKPENLLLSYDRSLKITDFGWCAERSAEPTDLAGTFRYMAPEVMARSRVQMPAVDVWSAGAAILELLTNFPLLSSSPDMCPQGPVFTPMLQEISERCPLLQERRPCFVSVSCWDLLGRMLAPSVEQRISIGEALQHGWINVRRLESAGGRCEASGSAGVALPKGVPVFRRYSTSDTGAGRPLVRIPTSSSTATPSPSDSLSTPPSPLAQARERPLAEAVPVPRPRHTEILVATAPVSTSAAGMAAVPLSRGTPLSADGAIDERDEAHGDEDAPAPAVPANDNAAVGASASTTAESAQPLRPLRSARCDATLSETAWRLVGVASACMGACAPGGRLDASQRQQ